MLMTITSYPGTRWYDIYRGERMVKFIEFVRQHTYHFKALINFDGTYDI